KCGVFAWSARDFVEINLYVLVHSLNLDPSFPHVKQRNRHFGPEKDKVIQEGKAITKPCLTSMTKRKVETSSRMIKWVVKLSEYDISYKPKMVTKAQVVVKFMSEAIPTKENEGNWLLQVDDSSNYSSSRVGVVLTSLEMDELGFA
ncbi:UNVERIFIED_CONTAM: hypothetical protein Scaly_2183900, partial [Sesamum calycinum]